MVGAQIQFGNAPWGAWVVGVEAALSDPMQNNSTGNFGLCANPAFGCGLSRLDNLTTVGARLGIAADRWLFTVSGGWASARFDRTDVLFATGALGTGGGASDERHNGAYVGGGIEYMIWKGPFADLIGGIDYQHIWLNDRDDLDANGVIHRMKRGHRHRSGPAYDQVQSVGPLNGSKAADRIIERPPHLAASFISSVPRGF